MLAVQGSLAAAVAHAMSHKAQDGGGSCNRAGDGTGHRVPAGFAGRLRLDRRGRSPLAECEVRVKTPFVLFAACFLLASTLFVRASPRSLPPPARAAVAAGLDCDGEPCGAVLRGLFAFVDRTPGGLRGNGRACADCHMPTDTFQLSPASVEARYQRLQRRRQRDPEADDPLFRPIDADDFRTRGDEAQDFSNLRQNALIRITLPLPPNIRLIDPATDAPSDETFADVWRSVPTVNDVALTGPDTVNPWPRGPNPNGGYQLDARLATLQDQALGALTNHAQILASPPQQILDDLASFQRVLFTNHRVRALAEAVRAGVSPLPDPDGPLTELEAAGKVVFVRACTQCHGGPGQSNSQAPAVRFHDIGSQCPRPVDTVTPARFAFAPCAPQFARNARTYDITLPSGTHLRRTSSDPGRALLTGFAGGVPAPQDDWNKFDVPGLRGLRKTAPYFHNNSAPTIEAVVDHYTEFFKRARAIAPPGVVPPALSTDGVHFDRPPAPEEREPLIAYLKRL
jgi:cytochrome c peroxidase